MGLADAERESDKMQMRRKDREVTDIEEIEEIIKGCKTCHVAMALEGEPYVVPLSYGYERKGDVLTLYFHSAKEGKKLDILHKNSRVCFEMALEGELARTRIPCNSGYYYSSVIGRGNVEFVEDVEEKCYALSLLMKHQAGWDTVFGEKQAETVCVYKICTKDFCGKKKTRPLHTV